MVSQPHVLRFLLIYVSRVRDLDLINLKLLKAELLNAD